MRRMTRHQVINLLQQAVDREGIGAYAARLGISRETVRLVLIGRREPGKAILDDMGVTKVVRRTVTYRSKA